MHYSLQLNDPENDVTVLVPTFGVFSDMESAQELADKHNKHCTAGMYYTAVPVRVVPETPAFTVQELRSALHAQS